MHTHTLMVQGTTSDAGKSTLVAGLCRVLRRRGIRVAPFKPQNMALNSAVGVDGGEIGRAQALQAQAAGIAPSVDLNPVLLKPSTDQRCQVIIHGRAVAEMGAWRYHGFKRLALEAVLTSYGRLREQYEVIVVEGAGSPAEINLRAGDIANMGFAEAVDCPVVLIADIDRGGVFAHIVGTMALLSESERNRVRGFVINRFRGDPSLLRPGLDWLERHSGKPVLGILPYLQGLHLDAEDAIDREAAAAASARVAAPLRVVIPVLPRISNHTDFEPLAAHPQVELRYIDGGTPPPPADLVVLPGSKSVRADLEWLRERGWPEYLARHLRYGGKLLGVCGGLQMLGRVIADPHGIEGAAGESPGLGWLDLTTVLLPGKRLSNVAGHLAAVGGARIRGYEIHAGRSQGPALERPAVRLDDGAPDGAVSADGQIIATYLHGLFEETAACTALLGWAGLSRPIEIDHAARREQAIDRLADTIESTCDLDRLWSLPAGAAPSRREG